MASFRILRYPSGSGSCARRNPLYGLAELKGAGLAVQKKSVYAAERVKQLRRAAGPGRGPIQVRG
jgi:hypothetical protein